MNYYPFHIGDYASATRHLSWDEDSAYRRLLDVYYTHEKPIQEDKAMRMAGAQTKTQREAVTTVLTEFFVLSADGWRHERCDAEIDAMRVKQAQQEEKDAHETDRMRRYRERRSQMFSALRSMQIVPSWDVPMKELQRLFDTHCNANSNAPATHLQREQAVSTETPATAIPTPTPTPTPKRSNTTPSKPIGIDDALWLDFLTVRKNHKAAVTQTALDGIEREAKKAGISLEQALRMCCERGWRGFEAKWLLDKVKTASSGEDIYEKNRRVADDWAKGAMQ